MAVSIQATQDTEKEAIARDLFRVFDERTEHLTSGISAGYSFCSVMQKLAEISGEVFVLFPWLKKITNGGTTVNAVVEEIIEKAQRKGLFN